MALHLIPRGKSPTDKQAKILRKTLVRYANITALAGTLTDEDRKVLEGSL